MSCLAFVGAGLALAAPGDPDRGFSRDGIAKTGFGPGGRGFAWPWALAVQPNDRIVIAGGSKSGDFGLARFWPNGKLDRSFGDGGTVRIDFGGGEIAEDVAIRRDGRIVVVGDAGVGDRPVIGIARLRPSGDLDPSFGTGGKQIVDPFDPSTETWEELSLALGPGGDIVVGGTTSVSGGGDSPGFVARLELDGDLDPSFAESGVKMIDLTPGNSMVFGTTHVNQVIVDRRGRVAAAVTPVVVSEDDLGYVRAVMVRLRSNGDYDPSFSGNGWKKLLGRYSGFGSIAAAPHGRLVGAGGTYANALVARVKGSGTFDRSFAGDGVRLTGLGDHGHVGAQDVMLQRNGKPLIAATFANGPSSHGVIVARLRRNGHLDDSFSGDGRTTVKRISRDRFFLTDTAMQSSGKILLTGVAGETGKAFVARVKNHGRPFVTP